MMWRTRMVIYRFERGADGLPYLVRLITNNGPESEPSLEAVSVPSAGPREPRRMCCDAGKTHYITSGNIGKSPYSRPTLVTPLRPGAQP